MNRRELLQALLAGVLTFANSGVARAADKRVITSKLALIGGRAVLALKIGDAGPYLFMLDTGGFVSMIDTRLAETLKLERTGYTNARGIGGQTVLPVYLAHNVVFGGGAVQPHVAFAGMQHGFEGTIKGALAAGMLTAVESDLDFEYGEWRAYPDGRPERIGFVRMANAIAGGERPESGSPHLFGDAEVNGHRMRFLLDTGAPSGLSLGASAARKLSLWDDSRPYAPQQTHGIAGVGGIGRIVRAQSLTFAGRRFDRPLVLLRAPADEVPRDADGIIGLELLRQFNLSTEPRERALWIQPFDAPPAAERYGLSGLWIDADSNGARVAAVGTGSPAARAGLVVGDRILDETFANLLQKLAGRPGAEVVFTVQRKDATQAVKFTLAEFL